MYDITILENSSSNCFDSVIYSLLKRYNFDYEAYNIKYFYTDYYEPLNYTTMRIKRGKFYPNILKDIFGINVVVKDSEESNNLLETIRNPLKNTPIGITIDPYYCHWSPFYQKAHYSHMVLIVDIDWQDRKYVCFDVHFNSVGYAKIDFDTVNKNFRQYFIFDFKETHELNSELIMAKINAILAHTLNNFNGNSAEKTTELVSYFASNDRKELFPANLETSIPLINLMWIAEDKRHFPIALKYIERKAQKSIFSSVYGLLVASEKSFALLRSVLIKYAVSGVFREETLKNIIAQIYDTDALIVEHMKTALKEINCI